MTNLENNNSGISDNNSRNVKRISGISQSKVLHVTLQPGEYLEKFVTTSKTIFYVHEGEGYVLINEDKIPFKRDRFFDCGSETACQFCNNGQCILSFFIIQVDE